MQSIIKDISLRYGLDTRVVQHIVAHPFVFVKRVITSVDDYRRIWIKYFGTFSIKPSIVSSCKFFIDRIEKMDLTDDMWRRIKEYNPDIDTKDKLIEYLKFLQEKLEFKLIKAMNRVIFNEYI